MFLKITISYFVHILNFKSKMTDACRYLLYAVTHFKKIIMNKTNVCKVDNGKDDKIIDLLEEKEREETKENYKTNNRHEPLSLC